MYTRDQLNDQPDAGNEALQSVLNRVKKDLVMKLAPYTEEPEECGSLVVVDIDEGGAAVAFKNPPEELCWRLQLAIRGM